jgi:hypothetical protein
VYKGPKDTDPYLWSVYATHHEKLQVHHDLNKILWGDRMIKGMTIREFLHREEISFTEKAKRHIKKNKSFYITVAGYTIFFICAGSFDVSAAGQMDIDGKGKQLYTKLVLGVGKWIVMFKGAFDIVQSAMAGDLASVKTKMIGYLLIFLALLGLPWAFDQVQDLIDSANG